MKSVLAIFAFLPFMAHASIQISALHSVGDSTDADATHMTQVLKSVGVKGYTDAQGYPKMNVKGAITITNGATCENGHSTYDISLVEMNGQGQEIQKIYIDNTDACNRVTASEKFYNLLDKWGGNLVQNDCGAGHCWKKIESIQCTFFKAGKDSPAFDTCTVEMSADQ